jgi:hypothetical protein
MGLIRFVADFAVQVRSLSRVAVGGFSLFAGFKISGMLLQQLVNGQLP